MNELLQAGAQKLTRPAVEAELYAQLEQYADRRTEAGAMQESLAMAISSAFCLLNKTVRKTTSC